jgi:hypothetical protein
MKKKDVIARYGSNNKTSKVIGLTRQAVDAWGEIIPVDWALKFDKMTNGELKFEKEMYQ